MKFPISISFQLLAVIICLSGATYGAPLEPLESPQPLTLLDVDLDAEPALTDSNNNNERVARGLGLGGFGGGLGGKFGGFGGLGGLGGFGGLGLGHGFGGGFGGHGFGGHGLGGLGGFKGIFNKF